MMDLRSCFNSIAKVLSDLVTPCSKPLSETTKAISKLTMTTQHMHALIRDYQENRITSPMENSLALYLSELKDVAYDADDVLDQFAHLAYTIQTRGWIKAQDETGGSNHKRKLREEELQVQ